MKEIKRTPAEITEMIRLKQMTQSERAVDDLYNACIKYQKDNIDINLDAEMNKSEAMVEANILTEEQLPKAKANGDWKQNLWTYYYTQKALLLAGERYSKTFFNCVLIPHSFAEVREERKTALATVDILQ